MKMTQNEIRSLKQKHRLELVMKETGEVFESDIKYPDLLKSMNTPGLMVDVGRQLFEIKLPGKADQSGDVIAWLMRRYQWTFGMAIKFLKKRSSDPKRDDSPQPIKVKKKRSAQLIKDVSEPLDHWQEKALLLGGERIREYFSWSYWDLVLYQVREGVRVEPTFAPQITRCERCDKRFDWDQEMERKLLKIPVLHGHQFEQAESLPIIAYSIKHALKISDLGLIGGGETGDAINDLITELGNLFVEDEDGIVCLRCAAREINFQRALSLCETSARHREKDNEKSSVIDGRGENA